MGKEDKRPCPHCNPPRVFVQTINYTNDIHILQVPPNHVLRINTMVHIYEANEPRPVQPDPPPGVKVRVESTEISSSSDQVVVRHHVWIEEVPLNTSTVDVHLYVKKRIPDSMGTLISVLEDGPVREDPRIGLKDLMEERFLFGNSQGQSRVDTKRNARTSIDHHPASTRPAPRPTRPAGVDDLFQLVKEMDALGKIVDWVDAVSRQYKCPPFSG
ncbi:uncharacterized protein LOC124264993 [Haliotis rubra]|uniref:uncharacterized protein LOC124264993 n=1 Tax=Haliotis rubra TaxID=36100 RepID=UPI001EE628F1|nr:uncharacterized protein LOC124264993 [Haliotis rubra]